MHHSGIFQEEVKFKSRIKKTKKTGNIFFEMFEPMWGELKNDYSLTPLKAIELNSQNTLRVSPVNPTLHSSGSYLWGRGGCWGFIKNHQSGCWLRDCIALLSQVRTDGLRGLYRGLGSSRCNRADRPLKTETCPSLTEQNNESIISGRHV